MRPPKRVNPPFLTEMCNSSKHSITVTYQLLCETLDIFILKNRKREILAVKLVENSWTSSLALNHARLVLFFVSCSQMEEILVAVVIVDAFGRNLGPFKEWHT